MKTEETLERKSTNDAFDSEFAAELEEMACQYGDGAVQVDIDSVQRKGDSVAVRFDPPIGDGFTKMWDVPHTPDASSTFTRLVDELGYSLVTADEIVNETAPFHYEDGDWELAYDEPTPPLRERLKAMTETASAERVTWWVGIVGGIAVFPVAYVPLIISVLAEEKFDSDDKFFIVSLATCLLAFYGVVTVPFLL